MNFQKGSYVCMSTHMLKLYGTLVGILGVRVWGQDKVSKKIDHSMILTLSVSFLKGDTVLINH